MLDLEQYHGDKYINSDDLHTLQEEASDERLALVTAVEEEAQGAARSEALVDLSREVALWDDAHGEEFEALTKLCDELPSHGVQLIRDDCFEEAMDDLIADCYSLPKDLPSFISLTIDYDALKQDYNEVEYGGNTYYWRD